MTVHHHEPTRSAEVAIVILLVLSALLALWAIWIWLGQSPTGTLALVHPSMRQA